MVSQSRTRSYTRSRSVLGAAAAAAILTTSLQAFAAAPAPRKVAATAGHIGNFSSGEMHAKTGAGWAAFHMAQGGEQPTASCSVVTDAATKKKALRFDGKIAEGAQYAFIGVGWAYPTSDASAPEPVDVSVFKGIRFRVRGDENPYRLQFLTSAVKDYNYHGRTFVAEKEWTTVEVPFTELKQTEGWGTPVVFSPKDVTVVSFGTMFQFNGAAWFEIADVEFYK